MTSGPSQTKLRVFVAQAVCSARGVANLNDRPRLDEKPRQVDSLVKEAAAVSAEVEHDALDAHFFEFYEQLLDVFRGAETL